jgi:hypothetical protein
MNGSWISFSKKNSAHHQAVPKLKVDVQLPSKSTIAPVMNNAAGEARNPATAATSLVLPCRPAGWRAASNS